MEKKSHGSPKLIWRRLRRRWRKERRRRRQVLPLALIWLGVMAGLVLLLQPPAPGADYGPAVTVLAPSQPTSSDQAAAQPAAAEPPWAGGSKLELLKSILRLAFPGLTGATPAPAAPAGADGISFLPNPLFRWFLEASGGISFAHPWSVLQAELPLLGLFSGQDQPVTGEWATQQHPSESRPTHGKSDDYRDGEEPLPTEEIEQEQAAPLIPLASWTAAVQARLGSGTSPGDEEGNLSGELWQPDGGGPAVFIYHSHGTEAFLGAIPVGSNIQPHVDGFTSDKDRNMIRVGQELQRTLSEDYGIPAVQSRSLFDWQEERVTRVGAYYRSLQMLTNYEGSGQSVTQRFPNLVLLLDLHRDAVPRQQSLVNLSNEQAARILFLVGTRNHDHPNWQQNMCVATVLNNILEEGYPGMSRGVRQRKERFNQHLLPGALLVEIGSVENTLDEALASARILARVINAAGQRGLLPQPGTPYKCPLGPMS